MIVILKLEKKISKNTIFIANMPLKKEKIDYSYSNINVLL